MKRQDGGNNQHRAGAGQLKWAGVWRADNEICKQRGTGRKRGGKTNRTARTMAWTERQRRTFGSEEWQHQVGKNRQELGKQTFPSRALK